MDARYYSVHRKPEWEEKGLQYNELNDLLRASEIIVLSAPTNVKVLGQAEFALLKPNSIIVQASIGTPFDRDAFLEWIAKDGNYAIFDQGVGSESYKIYEQLPRVILSPTAQAIPMKRASAWDKRWWRTFRHIVVMLRDRRVVQFN